MGEATFDPVRMRPRPVVNVDNAFFWEGVERGEFLVKRCAECKTISHPPRPMCAVCQSTDWLHEEASGTGTVYSFVVHHHPPLPGVEPGTIVALIEMEDGFRFVSNLVEVDPADVEIGMPVELVWHELDPTLTIPVFRPVPS